MIAEKIGAILYIHPYRIWTNSDAFHKGDSYIFRIVNSANQHRYFGGNVHYSITAFHEWWDRDKEFSYMWASAEHVQFNGPEGV